MVMLSTHEDALELIREFENSCREVLVTQGICQQDLDNAYLDLQWKFLHMLLAEKGTLALCYNRSPMRSKSHSIA
ncbi:hypothetical protein Desdi_2160 [Desulfitobacterium dichloroeliminans LMG P-21439]|uniref:Uncharacterized protein n=1 Tax=Desulfitobacterium dichloroeliminans (strain LMG P-21439 / DCA1) TaxID=871963 RepID=L0FAD0_DESDL|nr:hypothetical protein [Desulfitobacterium dichloroeliminans]AGA69601.1 hypothetical protein Desdi_2160 [Desulfitobacterium dichloroeliminans LMG P-21439]